MTQDLKRKIFLQLLLDSFNPSATSQLWSKLPIPESDIPKNRVLCPIHEPLKANLDFLNKMHYTWIANYISLLPDTLKKSAASAFPDFQKITETLKIGTEKVEKQGDVDPFLHQQLIEKSGLKNRLPICFLEKSTFDELLRWNRKKLLSLIDLLPLADASKEIKQIVDRNKLMLIYSALTDLQKNYIKHCLMTRHVTCDLQLNLKNWQGPKDKLKIYFHKVGLEIFAKALAQESPDFLFYLSHLLDTGRGKLLLSTAEGAKKDDKKETYIKNLNQAIKFISAHEKS